VIASKDATANDAEAGSEYGGGEKRQPARGGCFIRS
jgi:hypothetical protein